MDRPVRRLLVSTTDFTKRHHLIKSVVQHPQIIQPQKRVPVAHRKVESEYGEEACAKQAFGGDVSILHLGAELRLDPNCLQLPDGLGQFPKDRGRVSKFRATSQHFAYDIC